MRSVIPLHQEIYCCWPCFSSSRTSLHSWFSNYRWLLGAATGVWDGGGWNIASVLEMLTVRSKRPLGVANMSVMHWMLSWECLQSMYKSFAKEQNNFTHFDLDSGSIRGLKTFPPEGNRIYIYSNSLSKSLKASVRMVANRMEKSLGRHQHTFRLRSNLYWKGLRYDSYYFLAPGPARHHKRKQSERLMFWGNVTCLPSKKKLLVASDTQEACAATVRALV